MYFTSCMPWPLGMNTANAHNHRTLLLCRENEMVQRLGPKTYVPGTTIASWFSADSHLLPFLPVPYSAPKRLCLGEPTEDLLPPFALWPPARFRSEGFR